MADPNLEPHEPISTTSEPVPTSIPGVTFKDINPAAPPVISNTVETPGIQFTLQNPETPVATRIPGATFTNLSPAPEVQTPTTEASHAPIPTHEIPGATFTNTPTPPPETTIAPEVPPQNPTSEVPPAPVRTGLINKLKGIFGK